MNSKRATDAGRRAPSPERRVRIAFFDYPDVFEDFYPHYGVDQRAFGTTWHNTANHAWLRLVQQEIGEVTWYVTCVQSPPEPTRHEFVGCRIQWVRSSWLHRQLWRLFYLPKQAWRWRKHYRVYALFASYLAVLSLGLWRALRAARPDVLFVQDYCSGRYDVLWLFSRLLGIPLVALHSGSTADRYLGKALKRFTIPRADCLFPSGKAEAARLRGNYGIAESKLLILRPPIDTRVYQPMDRQACCAEFSLDPSRRYLLFVGRLDDGVKRISVILERFARLAGEHVGTDLVIAGSGRDEAALRSQADRFLAGRVHFVGWIADDRRKAMVYNVADCLILASWREASPAVIGEAFASGTPVISSDVGGISDLVRAEESGWLFVAGDDAALGRCLSEVMTQADQVSDMRRRVRQWALETVSQEVVRSTLKLGFNSIRRT